MKIILNIAAVIAIAILVGMFSSLETGHVLIFVGKYRIDLSLVTTFILIAILYILLYFAFNFSIKLFNIPTKIKLWRKRNSSNESRAYLNSAGAYYLAGKFESAYKEAIKSADKEKNKDNKFFALMLAFKSAGFMHDYEKEQGLSSLLADYTDKKWQLAKFMATAELQYRQKKYGLCLDNLNLILQLDKKHVMARRMMLKIFLRLGNFDKANEELNWLIKYDYLEKVEANSNSLYILQQLFDNSKDGDELIQLYRKINTYDNQLLNKSYLDNLIRLKKFTVALELIKGTSPSELGFGLGGSLLTFAKKLEDMSLARELLVVYLKYIEYNKQNSKLLLALGILSYNLNLWDSARGYVEASLLLKPTLDGYIYLSLIAKAQGDNGLSLSTLHNLSENIHNLV